MWYFHTIQYCSVIRSHYVRHRLQHGWILLRSVKKPVTKHHIGWGVSFVVEHLSSMEALVSVCSTREERRRRQRYCHLHEAKTRSHYRAQLAWISLCFPRWPQTCNSLLSASRDWCWDYRCSLPRQARKDISIEKTYSVGCLELEMKKEGQQTGWRECTLWVNCV